MHYTLYQINQFIRRFVALNLPDAVWIQAELVEADIRRGHAYLQLIEKGENTDEVIATGQAVFWQQQSLMWQRTHKCLLADFLQPGRMLKLLVKTEYHERYGLKFIIQDIDPAFTLGQLALQRQRTLAALQDNGFINKNNQIPLPFVVQRLAIISSPVAAGLQDFLSYLQENALGYTFRTDIFQAAMQGAQASPEIRRQLRTIERRQSDYDAVIIIRGGGAKTDLSDFDDFSLCEAVAQCSLPVFTGIGHETDRSLIDMVSHTSFKTPTAVAAYLVDRMADTEQQFVNLQAYLSQISQQYFQTASLQLDKWQNQISLITQQWMQKQYWQLEQHQSAIPQWNQMHLHAADRQLQVLEEQLRLLSLDATLQRGFSLLTEDGQLLDLPALLTRRPVISALTKDGIVKLKMDE
ncbi:MAG: exodeoxyribonuclease VII large subunit [Saprospiraceae bacterium]